MGQGPETLGSLWYEERQEEYVHGCFENRVFNLKTSNISSKRTVDKQKEKYEIVRPIMIYYSQTRQATEILDKGHPLTILQTITFLFQHFRMQFISNMMSILPCDIKPPLNLPRKVLIILLDVFQYNDLSPNFNCQYQLFNNTMSLSDSLWNISIDEPSLEFFDLYLDCHPQPFHHTFPENTGPKNIIEECLENSRQLAHPLADTQSEQKQSPLLAPPIQNRKKTSVQGEPREEGNGRRKKFKSSPYHNFQKHLNTAIRHIITFPSLQPDSPKVLTIAQRLWTVFLRGVNSTKKILSFIFNEFNEYRIKPNQLRDFGFEETYLCYSREQLGEAKTFLTKLAIDQLSEDNVADYLETRRIKHHQKFKKYLSVFRNELTDGFLKKRITNRNRKEKIKKQLREMNQ